MINETDYLQAHFLKDAGLEIRNILSDAESGDYSGCSFTLENREILFRKAKITPKKNGQFVTIWKRDPNSKQTEPYNTEDPYDFYIIFTRKQDLSGFFLFPKRILSERKIITSPAASGKRGIRVYPEWDIAESPQAEKTQKWQSEFFICFSDKDRHEKLKKLIGRF